MYRSHVLNVSTHVRPATAVVHSATLPVETTRVTTVLKKSNVHLDGTLHDIKRRYEEESRHVQQNFEVDYNNQMNLIKTVEELEVLLEEERRRSADMENKYNITVIELEKERRIRTEVEHDNVVLREELRRAESIIHDHELTMARLRNDVSNLEAENDALRAEIQRLADLYNIKLQEIEDRYILKISDLDVEILTLRNSLEQQRLNYENRLRDLDREWSTKYVLLEEVVRDNERVIVDLENEIRRLKEHNVQIKVDFEEDIRRQIALVRDEESHRYQIALKSVEARLHQVEIERDNLIRKNQDLVRELNNKESQIQSLRLQYEGEIARLRAEINDLRSQINALTVANENLRSELAARDLTISRLEGEIMNLEREITRIKNVHAQEINRLVTEHNNDRRRWEEAERLLKLRIDELELLVRTLESENGKLRVDLERIKANLADNVNKSIFQTFVGYETSPTVIVKSTPTVVVKSMF